MKKYKFKVWETVYFFSENYDPWQKYRMLLITDRLVRDNNPFYKCKSVIRKYDRDIDKDVIVKLNDFTLDLFSLIEENLPISFNYIPEKFLYKAEELDVDTPICSDNGCEIVSSFLEDDIPEEIKENKEIIFLNKCIERSQTLVNSYGDAIYALQKSIEEETISINKLRNKLAILTGDDALYAGTFIYTIED